MRARLGMCISERTTAKIRRHADKEHAEQDQDIRRQANLCMLVDCSAVVYSTGIQVQLYVPACVPSAWVHGLLTRVRSHFTVLSYSPEIPES